MQLCYGLPEDIEQWMNRVTLIRSNFPGLETPEQLLAHRATVLKFMDKRQAICVKEGSTIAGIMLFSRGHNMICCLAVSSEYRRRKIASMLMDEALENLDKTKEISVSTFRADDEKGTAPRALYEKYGFIAGELTEEFNYPNQRFVLHPIGDEQKRLPSSSADHEVIRKELQCKIYPLGSLEHYKYTVICASYQGKWILSRHKKRDTWETQGGHIEDGETPLECARRELFEESGIKDADIYPVCDYLGFNKQSHSNGMVFLAVVHSLGELPESEMKEIKVFDTLPTELTYPQTSPKLYAEATKVLAKL